MYSTVPTITPAFVAYTLAVPRGGVNDGSGTWCAGAAASPVDRAMPKSMISAVPSACSMMFAGLRSRWTTPTACAAASPDATERAMCSTLGIGRRASSRTAVARSTPSTYDIVMYLMPSI